jgi:tetratricopeptide (TPR) repeat protein
MEIMKLSRALFDCRGAMGAFICIASYSAIAQMPTKEAHSQISPVDSEKPPSSAELAATESNLRHDLELHPSSVQILYKLGQVLRQENKPKESLEIYTQASSLQKPDANQLRSVALDYVLLDDYKDAIQWLEIAASFDPRNVDVLYSLGRCYYTQSRYPEAEAMFLRVLQIKPDHLKAEENLGLVYDFGNQTAKAEAALRKAAEWAGQESTDEWPFLDLGGFLLDKDRAVEAVPFLQRAATINAKCADCHGKLGRALVAAGDVSDGVKELEVAARLDPANPKIHFQLGIAYRVAGALEKSRSEFALSQTLYGQHSRD